MYEFPHIRNLNDIRPAIAGRDEFIVAERDWGYVVNYNVNFADTFPTPNTDDEELNHLYKIRRECRGLIFDNNENIISRPLHKFFNINEREETQSSNIDLSQSHIILEKIDGSFIRPFRTLDGILRWGTKMGETEVANLVIPFLEKNKNYIDFAHWACDNNLTPIFEFTSRKQRIVVDYGREDNLTLLAIRHNFTGDYIPY